MKLFSKLPRVRQLARLQKSHRFRQLLVGISPNQLAHLAFDRFSGRSQVAVVGSAHKVGSTWLVHMIEDVIDARYTFEGRLVPEQFRAGFCVELSDAESKAYVSSLRGRWLFKTHTDIHAEVLQSIKPITVHRDLRDICVSNTHFGTNLAHEWGGYSPEISAMDFESRLEYELNRDYNLRRAEYWWRLPGARRVRYEELKSDPLPALQHICEFLGVKASTDRLEEAIRRHDFKRKSGRAAGKEEQSSFLRKGIVGDWKNAFSCRHIETFKHAHDGRWNKLLVDMGYEQTLDW